MLPLLAALALAAPPSTTLPAMPACPAQPLDAANRAAMQLELAFFQADDDTFSRAREDLRAAVPCIDTELALADVVQIHRAMAMVAFVAGDDDGTRRSFAAIRDVNPAWEPSGTLIPEGHPLRDLWNESATVTRTDPAPLPPNAGGWNVDAGRFAEVPTHRAFTLQAFTPTGEVVLTRYCPWVECLAEAERVATSVGATRRDLARRRSRWLGSGVGVALVGVGVGGFVVAADARREFDATTEVDRLDEIQARARTGVVAGWVGTGLGAATLGAAWTLTW